MRGFGKAVGLVIGLMLISAPISAAQVITEFTVPTPLSQPAGITLGPDGALWFTEENAHKIGRITTAGAITEYPTPTQPSAPTEITTGPDGALWFTEFGANPPKIGRLTTSGAFTEFDLPLGSGPDGITAGPDGAIWFTMNSAAKIGRITLDGSSITQYSLPSGFVPSDITPGPDGRLWFTEAEPSNKIGAIRMDGSISEYDVPGAGPAGITASGGALWFTMHLVDKIGRIETDGFPITEFGPTGDGPDGIALGPDGAFWFAEEIAGKIGRMTAAGSISEFALPSASSEPGEIVAGPDGAMWFTEFAGNRIGRIGVSEPPPPPFTGYPRPKSASPVRVPLVPAYNRCVAPNRTHGPSLEHPSCNPPSQQSDNVTVGTPDANGKAAKSVGYLSARALVGDPNTPAEESDVLLDMNLTDVRWRFQEDSDYIGELRATFALRITDKLTEALTMRDFAFAANVQCAPTADATIGGTCALQTSANAITPSLVREGERTIWQIGQVWLIDGGEDGLLGTEPDNDLFAKQGIFVP